MVVWCLPSPPREVSGKVFSPPHIYIFNDPHKTPRRRRETQRRRPRSEWHYPQPIEQAWVSVRLVALRLPCLVYQSFACFGCMVLTVAAARVKLGDGVSITPLPF